MHLIIYFSLSILFYLAELGTWFLYLYTFNSLKHLLRDALAGNHLWKQYFLQH